MLKTMRESFHHLKWTLFAVIIVFVLGFVFFSGGGGGTGPKDPSGQMVATRRRRDDHARLEFDRQYRSSLQRQQQHVPGQPLARAHPRHGPAPPGARRHDRPDPAARGREAGPPEGLRRRRSRRRSSPSRSSRRTASSSGEEKYERFLHANSYTPDRFEERGARRPAPRQVPGARQGLRPRVRRGHPARVRLPQREGVDRVHQDPARAARDRAASRRTRS